MGKATITIDKGDGLYTVELDHGQELYDAEYALLDEKIIRANAESASVGVSLSAAEAQLSFAQSDLNGAIDFYSADPSEANKSAVESNTTLVNTRTKEVTALQTRLGQIVLSKTAAVKRQAVIFDIYDGEPETIDLWCADYNPGLVGEVGTIDIGRAGSTTPIIKPAGTDGDEAIYDGAEDGQLLPITIMTANSAYNSYALQPGAAKWLPRYRYGTITATDGDTCTVELDPALSGEQALNINQTDTVECGFAYMNCNGAIFEVGDMVVVAFEGFEWGNAVVVGFVTNPKKCALIQFLSVSVRQATFGTTNFQFMGTTNNRTSAFFISRPSSIGFDGASGYHVSGASTANPDVRELYFAEEESGINGLYFDDGYRHFQGIPTPTEPPPFGFGTQYLVNAETLANYIVRFWTYRTKSSYKLWILRKGVSSSLGAVFGQATYPNATVAIEFRDVFTDINTDNAYFVTRHRETIGYMNWINSDLITPENFIFYKDWASIPDGGAPTVHGKWGNWLVTVVHYITKVHKVARNTPITHSEEFVDHYSVQTAGTGQPLDGDNEVLIPQDTSKMFHSRGVAVNDDVLLLSGTSLSGNYFIDIHNPDTLVKTGTLLSGVAPASEWEYKQTCCGPSWAAVADFASETIEIYDTTGGGMSSRAIISLTAAYEPIELPPTASDPTGTYALFLSSRHDKSMILFRVVLVNTNEWLVQSYEWLISSGSIRKIGLTGTFHLNNNPIGFQNQYITVGSL